MRLFSRRFFLSVLPAAALLFIGAILIWGENGVLVRFQLDEQLEASRNDLAVIDGSNRRLLREMRVMQVDPVVVERMVADELGWSREGDTLVRFDE